MCSGLLLQVSPGFRRHPLSSLCPIVGISATDDRNHAEECAVGRSSRLEGSGNRKERRKAAYFAVP